MRVRARSVVWVELADDRPALRGWLSDERGVRLPGRRLLLRIGAAPARWIETDRDGEFLVTDGAPTSTATVRVSFPGGPFHEASSLEREVDPARLPVRLELLAPTEVSVAAEAVEIQVHAEQAERSVSVPVRISLSDASGTLAEVTTERSGWALATLEPSRLGQPGQRTLLARYDGDARLAPSLARAEILVFEPTRITMEAPRTRVRPGDEIRVHGVLAGALGPVSGEEVAIWGEGRTLAVTRTEDDGDFEAAIEAADLDVDATTELVARYDSPLRARASAISEPVSVLVQRPEPLPLWVVLVPGLLTLAVLIVILLLSRRARGARPRKERAQPSDRPVASGLQEPRGRPRFSLARASSDVGGVVWDPVEERPVAGALVAIRGPGGSRRIRADRRGRFSARALDAGNHEVAVQAEGYVPESFGVSCPHDGGSERLRVHLVQVRHRALEAYRLAASELLPSTDLWGFWTPREVAVHAVRDRPWLADGLAQLTTRFEETYYSGTVGSLDDLAEVRTLARALRRARDETDARPDG